MERSTERWNWWKCLCELASGRKEVIPLLEAASFLIVSVTAECWSCCSDLGGSHSWGAVLSLTLTEHPVKGMGGRGEGAGAAQV